MPYTGSFKPGNTKNTSRIIKYISQYNALYGVDGEIKSCYCIPNKFDKNTPGSDSVADNISYSRRISQIVHSSKNGKIQYGNFYLGEPLKINYLGRMEGMSGGSGMPPKNKF
jgi:hypothetical protein